jgi:hypothetical protein
MIVPVQNAWPFGFTSATVDFELALDSSTISPPTIFS